MDKRFSRRWLGLIAAGTFVAMLSACGGDDGATGPAGPAGPAGPPGPVGTSSVDVSTISAEDWASSNFSAEVTGVVVASPPVVTFTVSDDKGLPVVGLEKLSTQERIRDHRALPELRLHHRQAGTRATPAIRASGRATSSPA